MHRSNATVRPLDRTLLQHIPITGSGIQELVVRYKGRWQDGSMATGMSSEAGLLPAHLYFN